MPTRLSQIRFLVYTNPFIPPDHIQIFLKGLHSGLLGDIMLAVHLLMPQLENSLRFVLNQHGIDAANIDSEGLEQNKALGKLLEFPELKRLLGDKLIFELRLEASFAKRPDDPVSFWHSRKSRNCRPHSL
jgi:hypothetical protein